MTSYCEKLASLSQRLCTKIAAVDLAMRQFDPAKGMLDKDEIMDILESGNSLMKRISLIKKLGGVEQLQEKCFEFRTGEVTDDYISKLSGLEWDVRQIFTKLNQKSSSEGLRQPSRKLTAIRLCLADLQIRSPREYTFICGLLESLGGLKRFAQSDCLDLIANTEIPETGRCWIGSKYFSDILGVSRVLYLTNDSGQLKISSCSLFQEYSKIDLADSMIFCLPDLEEEGQ
jgi:hypothetical protein